MADEKLLTTAEAAELLRVTVGTVKNWIYAGEIEAVKLPGGHYRIPRDKLMSGLRAVGTGAGRRTDAGDQSVEAAQGYLARLGYGTPAPLLAAVRRVAEEHRLRMLLAFGSTVAGAVHQNSDIDIAADRAGRPLDYSELVELAGALQRLFLSHEVDVVSVGVADPLLLRKICESCVLLYGDTTRLAEFRMYAYKRSIDHERFFAMERSFAIDFGLGGAAG